MVSLLETVLTGIFFINEREKNNNKKKPPTSLSLSAGNVIFLALAKAFVLKMPCTNDKSASQQGGNLEVIKVNENFSMELGFCLKIFMLLFR